MWAVCDSTGTPRPRRYRDAMSSVDKVRLVSLGLPKDEFALPPFLLYSS